MKRIDERFVPRIEQSDGFAAYQVIDCGNGTLYTVSTFADREGADRSIEMAAEFVRDELADVEIERLEADQGEVGVSRPA
jgi:hypothetical protein